MALSLPRPRFKPSLETEGYHKPCEQDQKQRKREENLKKVRKLFQSRTQKNEAIMKPRGIN